METSLNVDSDSYLPSLLKHLERNVNDCSQSFKLILDVNSLSYLSSRIQMFIEIISTVQKPEHKTQLLLHALQGFPEKDFEILKSLVSMVVSISTKYNVKLKILPTPPKLSKMDSDIDLGIFESLKSLEIYDVDKKWISHLSVLRPTLLKLSVTASIQSTDEILSKCLSKKEIVESSTWKSLRVLRLSHNMISKLDNSLSLLPSVEFIDLSHNKIKSISHFQDCYNLRRLDLSFNQIEDLSDIAKCVGNISELLLRHNQIQSADGLNRLPALEKLDLSYNQIGTTTAIEMLRDIAFLKDLWLEMNPFAYKNGYRLFIQRIFKECPNCFDMRLDSKPLFGNTDSAEFDAKGIFASDSFNSIQALQKKAQLSKEKYKVKPKLIQITPNDKKKHDVISSSPSQVADSAKNLVQHAEALKHDVGKKWLSVLTEEKSQKSDSKDDDSEDTENSFYQPKLDESKESEVQTHEETIPISRFSNSSNHSKKSIANSENVLYKAPSDTSEEKKSNDVVEEIAMISPLSSPLNPEDVEHVCDQDQWTVFVGDHRRVLCISKGVVMEKDLSRGSIISEYHLSEIRNYMLEKKVLKVYFHKGKFFEYFVPDVQELSEICKIIEEHQISKTDVSASNDIDKRISSLEDEASASMLMDPSKNLIVMSDYFHSDSKSSVLIKSSQDKTVSESHVISQFISQYRSKRLTSEFSEKFQVGVIEHKRNRSEQSAVFLFHEKRIYLFDKSQIETNDLVVTVIANKCVASISKIIIGFFMRYMRLDFNDNSSLLIITRDKEKSTHLVQLLLSSTNGSDALISLQNRDAETLDAFQAQVLKGATEDIKLYELLFDGEGKESGSGKLGSARRTLILTDKRAFLCWEDHQKWAKDSFNSLFTVISSELRTKFLGSDSKEYRSSGQFSLIFGSEKQFAAADSKRKWTLYTRDSVTMNRILDELARKV